MRFSKQNHDNDAAAMVVTSTMPNHGTLNAAAVRCRGCALRPKPPRNGLVQEVQAVADGAQVAHDGVAKDDRSNGARGKAGGCGVNEPDGHQGSRQCFHGDHHGHSTMDHGKERHDGHQ